MVDMSVRNFFDKDELVTFFLMKQENKSHSTKSKSPTWGYVLPSLFSLVQSTFRRQEELNFPLEQNFLLFNFIDFDHLIIVDSHFIKEVFYYVSLQQSHYNIVQCVLNHFWEPFLSTSNINCFSCVMQYKSNLIEFIRLDFSSRRWYIIII